VLFFGMVLGFGSCYIIVGYCHVGAIMCAVGVIAFLFAG